MFPDDHLKRFDVLQVRVGTDPDLTMKTRRGTGCDKVASLKKNDSECAGA